MERKEVQGEASMIRRWGKKKIKKKAKRIQWNE
jgi:hypothetical protein